MWNVRVSDVQPDRIQMPVGWLFPTNPGTIEGSLEGQRVLSHDFLIKFSEFKSEPTGHGLYSLALNEPKLNFVFIELNSIWNQPG